MTWTLSLLGAVLFYVATWPPIHTSHSHSPGGGSSSFFTVVTKPTWVDILYRPLQRLSEMHRGENSLMRYYTWWHDILA